MDISNDSKPNFFKHVFNFSDDSKSDMLNICQYSIVALIPIVILNKIMQKYVPMTYIPRVTFSYTEDPDILDLLENDYREIYHYRCHSDENHTKTIYYMEKIYKKIYG